MGHVVDLGKNLPKLSAQKLLDKWGALHPTLDEVIKNAHAQKKQSLVGAGVPFSGPLSGVQPILGKTDMVFTMPPKKPTHSEKLIGHVLADDNSDLLVQLIDDLVQEQAVSQAHFSNGTTSNEVSPDVSYESIAKAYKGLSADAINNLISTSHINAGIVDTGKINIGVSYQMDVEPSKDDPKHAVTLKISNKPGSVVFSKEDLAKFSAQLKENLDKKIMEVLYGQAAATALAAPVAPIPELPRVDFWASEIWNDYEEEPLTPF